MELTDEGIVAEVRFIQIEKADSPIDLTPFEMIAETNFSQL